MIHDVLMFFFAINKKAIKSKNNKGKKKTENGLIFMFVSFVRKNRELFMLIIVKKLIFGAYLGL